LNGLQGLDIRNISITLQPAADGSNMRAQVFIPNPSPLTIEMGTLSLNVYVGETLIGVATIEDLTLRPGDNTVPMTAVADAGTTIGLINSEYHDARLPVRIIGNNSTVDGQLIPYFSAALASAPLTTTLDLGPALAALGLNIGGEASHSSSTSAAPVASATAAA
jgi:hypothetical protein